MTGDLILNGAPTSDLMASTKKYVDDKMAGVVVDPPDLSDYFKKDGSVIATGDFDMGAKKITNVTSGDQDTDLVTKGYIDTALNLKANSSALITNYLSKTSTTDQTIASNISMNSTKIISQS